ncbi:sensor histidine kinase [Aestuariivirga sp.]|uniref:sensor histidine kinase n=1 Tax=Aestuariivirga sp. TaxID=2650926 RepID=UPI00359300C6
MQKASWPRVHLIYFALASVDVAAIAASLVIGFHMLSTFEKGADRNLSFDRQSASLIAFSSAITETQSVVVSGLMQKQLMATAADVRLRAATFRREFALFRQQMNGSISSAALSRITPILSKMESGFNSMEASALKAMDDIAAGNAESAWRNFSQMQSRYTTLQFLIRDVSQKANLLRKSGNESDLAAVRGIQKYEYLIAGLLAFIILGIIAYGHFVGRLMQRKYAEVADANERLAASNDEIQAHAAQVEAVNREVAALNQQMQENLTRLRETQDELLRKGKMAQLGQLTATVAHELRNPLGAVRTSAFLLERKLKDKQLGVEPQIERINNGVTRCDSIISQLLDFARSKAVQPETLALDDWLAKLVEEEAQRLPSAVSVECRLGLGELAVPFDPARLSRALINLLSNASEAMVGKGDDPSKLTTRNPTISIATRRSARGAEVSVSDNGPGIASEHLEKIFEPLFTTKNFGTGLGLPAVQKIMEQHGGGLEVSSAPGQGATFTIWWPVTGTAEIAA